MQRLRYTDVAQNVYQQAGVCSDSPDLLRWTNRFEQRALNYGRWWGSTQLAQFCIQTHCGQACVVLPREVAVIEAASLAWLPVNVQNMWGQFIRPHVPLACGGNSSGVPCSTGVVCHCGCGCGVIQMQDEGMVPTFGVTAAGEKIRFYFNPADVGKKIVVQGNDSNGVWVRTEFDDGMVQDGEQVTLATTGGQYYTDTSTEWAVGSPTQLYKEVTSYNVIAWGLNSDGDTTRQLANYQPDEVNPTYRKVRIVGAPRRGRCGTPNLTLRAIVSLQHVPMRNANDWCLFTNLAAYADGIMSEKLRENLAFAEADAYFFGTPKPARNGRGVLRVSVGTGAIPLLESELRKQTGDTSSVLVQRDGLVLNGFV